MTRSHSLLLILGWLTLVGLTRGPSPACAQAPKDGGLEFHHDFRGRPLPPQLTWFNAEDGKFFRNEAEGVRIVIPDTWVHPWGGIGFRTSFGFGGDFEVTLALEILHADTPRQGYGVGVCLNLARDGGGAGLCRLTRKGGREIVLWDHAHGAPGDQNPPVDEGFIPCADKICRLRLKRGG